MNTQLLKQFCIELSTKKMAKGTVASDHPKTVL